MLDIDQSKIRDQPQVSITIFNAAYIAWLQNMERKYPSIDFEAVLNSAHAAAGNDTNLPMYLFQLYTADQLDKIFKQDPCFFSHMYKVSNGHCIPQSFPQDYNGFTSTMQQEIWDTIKYLVHLVAAVYPEYNALYVDAKANT